MVVDGPWVGLVPGAGWDDSYAGRYRCEERGDDSYGLHDEYTSDCEL